MAAAYPDAPPFSPELVAGLLARPLPLGPLNLLLSRALRQMHAHHSSVFERMEGIGSPSFIISPVDLPFDFHLSTCSQKPSLRAIKSRTGVVAAATIRGPLRALLALLEGGIDGDALFFSRTLSVEGDMEAVLALRNAVDGSDIDLLTEAKSFFGLLAGPLTPLARQIGHMLRQGQEDVNLLQRAFTKDQDRRLAAQGSAIETLEKQVQKLGKRAARKRA